MHGLILDGIISQSALKGIRPVCDPQMEWCPRDLFDFILNRLQLEQKGYPLPLAFIPARRGC